MAVLAALLAVGWAVSVLALLRSADRARREHSRREDLLVNQVCALAGHPWLPPPAEVDDTPSWSAPAAGEVEEMVHV